MDTNCCRLCLSALQIKTDFCFLLDSQICKKFKDITQIELEINTKYPSLICSSCLNELDKMYQYRTTLIEKELRLKGIVNFMIENVEPKPATDDVAEEEDQEQFQVTCIESNNEEKDSTQNQISKIEHEDDEDNDDTHEEEDLKEEPDSQMYIENYQEFIDDKEEIQYLEETDEDTYFLVESKKQNELPDKSSKPQVKSLKRTFNDSEKIYRCWIDGCDVTFPFRISLKRHMSTVHNVFVSKSSCLICGQEFPLYTEFLTHSKIHRKFPCEFCQSIFSKQETLEAHIKRFHKRADDDDRPYECADCSAKFKRKEHLKSHIAYKHSTDRKFKCTNCSMSFFQKMDLKNHQRTHTGERPFKCSRCSSESSGFRDLKSLKRHSIVSHKTNKIYICDYCECDFELHRDFLLHKKTHGSDLIKNNCNEVEEITYI